MALSAFSETFISCCHISEKCSVHNCNANEAVLLVSDSTITLHSEHDFVCIFPTSCTLSRSEIFAFSQILSEKWQVISFSKAYKPFILFPCGKRYLESIDTKCHCYPVPLHESFVDTSDSPVVSGTRLTQVDSLLCKSVCFSNHLILKVFSKDTKQVLYERTYWHTSCNILSWWKSNTFTPIFFFCLLGKFDSCFFTSYGIQGGFREAAVG